jgi:hypothetical protein
MGYFIMIVMIIVNWSWCFKYRDVSGWGFAAVGVGFFGKRMGFSSLKGRL